MIATLNRRVKRMYDVLIVGYGPTGMLAAALLGRAGHRVAVLERYKTLYNLPRVGIVHDDILRMFQEIGCIERVWPHTYFLPVYEMAKNGRVLLSSEVAPEATHGWPEYISIYQPAFEGERVTAIAQNAGHVAVTAETEAGRKRTVLGRYLIGSDGGNSFVREALGVPY